MLFSTTNPQCERVINKQQLKNVYTTEKEGVSNIRGRKNTPLCLYVQWPYTFCKVMQLNNLKTLITNYKNLMTI